MIRFNNVWAGKMHGHPAAYLLKNLTYDFSPGRHTGILCANRQVIDCLDQLLCGMIYPQRGEIIRGASVSWPIGSTGVFAPGLTCRENLQFLARIHGVPSRPICDFVADFTGLADLFSQRFLRLDKYSKARIAFATPFGFAFDYYLGVNNLIVLEGAFRERCLSLTSKMMKNSTLILASTKLRHLKLHTDNFLQLDDDGFRAFSEI